MILFPAIDILDGRAVRLKHGDKSQATVYGEPLDFAEMWAEAGAEYLHVVDLSGAFSGESGIDDVIREIKSKFGIPIESGGGLRSIEDIARRLDAGADRVIIGTMAICHPDEFALAVYKFGNKIVAGIDAKDGYFAVSGWTEQTDVKAVDFGKKVRRMGLEYALFTDISKDGVLGGANVEATVNMSRETGLNVGRRVHPGRYRQIERERHIRRGARPRDLRRRARSFRSHPRREIKRWTNNFVNIK